MNTTKKDTKKATKKATKENTTPDTTPATLVKVAHSDPRITAAGFTPSEIKKAVALAAKTADTTINRLAGAIALARLTLDNAENVIDDSDY